jgi:hypothetical protein
LIPNKTFFIGFLSIMAVLLIGCKNTDQGYQVISASKESCLSCHSKMTGFSRFHDPKTIGCASCHLGNIHSNNKNEAHKGIVLIPGNLQNASQTCATANCHSKELNRIQKSLMTTNSGIISVDKYLFDELKPSDSLFHIEHLGQTAADMHLKNKCATCHLGNEKTHFAAVDEQSRGGGCLACHLNYEMGTKPNIKDQIHPEINLNVDNTKCFGCHSRSGRIATNYEGWRETLSTPNEIKNSKNHRILMDGRVFEKTTADVHHKSGMLCIDCHISQEIMGDGKSYKHEADAIKISCEDCHTQGKPIQTKPPQMDYISALDYGLRGYKHSPNSFLVTKKGSIPLVNTYKDSKGNAFLVSKISKKELSIKPSCKRDAVHQKVSCSMCHTAWASTCIGCHTDYDPRVINADKTLGKWIEHVAEFGFAPPTIGVKITGNNKEFVPAIPGMIMTLDKSNFKGNKKGNDTKFVRWYAPNAAHTTTKTVRNCASCHINSQALGFGKGTLNYVIKSKTAHWEFTSYYANAPQDGLPQDAWIGFLKDLNKKTAYSSHAYFYPLDLKEQKKMLQVGACIHCHEKDDTFLKRLTDGNYLKMLKAQKKECIIP